MFQRRSHWKGVAVILAFLPAVLLRFVRPLHIALFIDEGNWNLGPKYALLFGNPLSDDLHYIFLSPLHYYTTLIVYALLSPSLLWSRWLSALFGVGIIILTYLLAKKFLKDNAPLIAAALCAYNTLLLLSSRCALLEQEATFYMLAAGLFWFHSRPRLVWLSGLFLGAALLVKITALALLPTLLVAALYLPFPEPGSSTPIWRRISKSQWIAIALAVVISALGYYAVFQKNPELFLKFWRGHSTDRIHETLVRVFQAPAAELRNMFSFLGVFARNFPDLLIFALLGVLLGYRKQRKLVVVLVSWFAFTFVLISFQEYRTDRYYYHIIPALAILAAIGLLDVLSRFRKSPFRTALPLVLIVFMCTGQILRFLLYYRDGESYSPYNQGTYEAVHWLEQKLDPNEPIYTTRELAMLMDRRCYTVSMKFMYQTEDVDQQFYDKISQVRYAILPNPIRPESSRDLISQHIMTIFYRHFMEIRRFGQIVVFEKQEIQPSGDVGRKK